MRIIRGTKDAKGVVISKQPAGGTGRSRCMHCHGLITDQRLPDGTKVQRCNTCGRTSKSVAMDRPTAKVVPVRVGVPRPKGQVPDPFRR
jgi:hypothetical protein